MATLLGLVGATLGGWAGAWLATGLGPLGVHLVATVAGGLGFYYGRRLAASLLA